MSLNSNVHPHVHGAKAGCSASRSITRGLSRAAQVLVWEWFDGHDLPKLIFGLTCHENRDRWKEWTSSLRRIWDDLGRERGVGFCAFNAAVKSCNRLFDEPCRNCDETLFEDEKNDFISEMTSKNEYPKECVFSQRPLEDLKWEVRRILGKEGFKVDRRLRVPNQRGCGDSRTTEGGTLAARPWEQVDADPNGLRVTVAKTKGKARVVTLQNSYVKDILRPIHEGLYDHLSQNEWLVRGELKAEHLSPLVDDLRAGELYISGDYSSATNHIRRESVMAVVEVICESDQLTLEEKRVLWESFNDLYIRTCTGQVYRLRRGAMMGSYVTFPILCLINRALYNLTRRWEWKILHGRRGWPEERVARFNGDDCAFCGSLGFFRLWEIITDYHGLVVNREKTGLSKERVELNSKTYFVRLGRFAPKPVLTFLDCKSEALLLQAYEQSLGLSFGTRMRVLNHLILPWIRSGDVSPESLPKGLFRYLVKRRWFRTALDNERTRREKIFFQNDEGKFECEQDRGIPMVRGPLLQEQFYDWFDSHYKDCQRQYLEEYRGKKVTVPLKVRKERKPQFQPGRSVGIWSQSPPKWGMIWPKHLYEFAVEKIPDLLSRMLADPWAKWVTDHPFLYCQRVVERRVNPRFFPPVLEGDWINERGVDGGVWVRQ